MFLCNPKPGPPTLVGFDAGAAIGWSVVVVDKPGFYRYAAHGVLRAGADTRGAVEAIVGDWAPTFAVVEIPGKVVRAPAATHLVQAAAIGGELAGQLRGLVALVETVTAAEVRKALCRKATAGDADVKQAVQWRVQNWPRLSQNHARDACAASVFAWERAALKRRTGS